MNNCLTILDCSQLLLNSVENSSCISQIFWLQVAGRTFDLDVDSIGLHEDRDYEA